ncbi:hypothetical protein [Marinimicrobium locisalis]|uniref:hypothetical protein n=1 Tax=Marinimicrobium locisalis TaxID=546022 RepID=UPI0032216CC3
MKKLPKTGKRLLLIYLFCAVGASFVLVRGLWSGDRLSQGDFLVFGVSWLIASFVATVVVILMRKKLDRKAGDRIREN